MFVALLLENIFRQLSSEAVRVSQSATVSFVIEELIPLADKSQLTALLDQLSADWETVCCDQYASHVIQALVMSCGNFIRKALHCVTIYLFLVNMSMCFYVMSCHPVNCHQSSVM